MRKIINMLCVAGAFLCIGIGSAGIVLPVLPTTPFFLLALILFTKGSERFHKWFLKTQLYKNYLEDFVVSKSMTLKAKIRVLTTITILFAIGVWFSPMFAKIMIGIVALFHYVYIWFGIPTIKENKTKLEGVVND